MKTITAKFRIVTPMFLGDAGQEATSIRPPSIKGALRFWWRALNWKRAVEAHQDNENAALKWLHDEEARLFGIAVDDNGRSGQGAFLINVSCFKIPDTYSDKFDGFTKSPGLIYLLGQGLSKYDKNSKRTRLTRSAFREDQTFHISLAFKPSAKVSDIDSILEAFSLFGLLGGLGSRSRHGLGSIQIEKIEAQDIQLPLDIELFDLEGYSRTVKQLVGKLSNENEPPFSAFSRQSECTVVVKDGSSAKDVLNAIGKEMHAYRSWKGERNFSNDHDNVINMELQTPPRRVVFGLPHNYHYSSSSKNYQINAYFGNIEARRASPLLLHIHRLKDGTYIGVHTLMRSRFLPDEATIKINKKPYKNMAIDWSVIENYLDRFDGQKRILP